VNVNTKRRFKVASDLRDRNNEQIVMPGNLPVVWQEERISYEADDLRVPGPKIRDGAQDVEVSWQQRRNEQSAAAGRA
jgi:hypothetical protein